MGCPYGPSGAPGPQPSTFLYANSTPKLDGRILVPEDSGGSRSLGYSLELVLYGIRIGYPMVPPPPPTIGYMHMYAYLCIFNVYVCIFIHISSLHKGYHKGGRAAEGGPPPLGCRRQPPFWRLDICINMYTYILNMHKYAYI